MKFTMRLDPVKGMAAITDCAARFLEREHMPSPAAAAAMPADGPAELCGSPNVRLSLLLSVSCTTGTLTRQLFSHAHGSRARCRIRSVQLAVSGFLDSWLSIALASQLQPRCVTAHCNIRVTQVSCTRS